MANFDTAFGITDAHEGGWVNDPADRGGETWRGVARKSNPYWPGWAIIDAAKAGLPGNPGSREWVAALNAKLAADADLEEYRRLLFRNAYWSPLKLDSLPLLVAVVAYDISVNSGPRAAGRLIQRAINAMHDARFPVLVVDGLVGAKTMALVANADPLALALTMCDLRCGEYLRIKGERFDEGWANRNDSLVSTVHRLAREGDWK